MSSSVGESSSNAARGPGDDDPEVAGRHHRGVAADRRAQERDAAALRLRRDPGRGLHRDRAHVHERARGAVGEDAVRAERDLLDRRAVRQHQDRELGELQRLGGRGEHLSRRGSRTRPSAPGTGSRRTARGPPPRAGGRSPTPSSPARAPRSASREYTTLPARSSGVQLVRRPTPSQASSYSSVSRCVPSSSTVIVPCPRRPLSSPVPDSGTIAPSVTAPAAETVPR